MRPECRDRISPGAGGLAKAPGSVQPHAGFKSSENKGKSRRTYPAASWTASRIGEIALDTARFAKNLQRLAVATHLATVTPTMLPHMSAIAAHTLPFAEPGEHHETMLLRLVEALVEGAGCVGELLQSGSALTHHIGAQVKPFDRIFRTVGISARRKALRALLGEIAQSGFDWRPKFFLLGRELQPRMKRGDTRVTKGRNIGRTRAPALGALEII